ncbi:hypothetical protein ABH931_004706 [Streptacidiphilus sp. MAP12-33]|uniref:hypothetical protein n=1 Tax=Streptacidiphilus sp. MAP12-33 TaxID=3156266 RepID=UPI0035152FA5
MRWGTQPRWARWVAVVYVVGFLEGTGVHAYDAIVGGVHAFRGWTVPDQVLAQSLLLFDPLAVAWTVLARPAGPVLGAAVMAADLAANWGENWDGIVRHPLDYVGVVGITPMTLFGLFVLATAFPLYRSFSAAERAPLRIPR